MWVWAAEGRGEGGHPRTICFCRWAVNVHTVVFLRVSAQCTVHRLLPLLCLAVRSEHGIRYVKLPSASSTSSVLRFLENLCQYLESDSVFSSQPFSPFSSGNTRFYNRTKSGGQNLQTRKCKVQSVTSLGKCGHSLFRGQLYGRGLGTKEEKNIKMDFFFQVSNSRIRLKFPHWSRNFENEVE